MPCNVSICEIGVLLSKLLEDEDRIPCETDQEQMDETSPNPVRGAPGPGCSQAGRPSVRKAAFKNSEAKER